MDGWMDVCMYTVYNIYIYIYMMYIYIYCIICIYI